MARMTIRTAWESAGVAVGQNTRTRGAGVIRIGKLGIQADVVGVGQGALMAAMTLVRRRTNRIKAVGVGAIA